MAAPVAGMITSVTFVGRSNEQRILNTVHYRNKVQWDSPTIDTYYNSFYSHISLGGAVPLTQKFLGCLCEQYTLTGIRLQVVWPIRYRGKTFSENEGGGRLGFDNAQNVTAVITKTCELSGRSKVGSIHLGGLAAADYTNGLLVQGLKDKMAELAATMLLEVSQDFGTGINEPVLYHPSPNANPKYDVLTGMIIQDTLRTQRTRNVGKGE
jgi:hypothetical protein